MTHRKVCYPNKWNLKWFFLCFLLWAAGSCQNNENEDKSGENKGAASQEKRTGERKTILFFGNSLTAGYGLDDPSQAFPALIQDSVNAYHLPYKVINGGLSGETSAGGKSRIDWLLKQKIDVFVLELGANDGLRGIPISETAKNLQEIINKVTSKYPDVRMVLAGMQVPPNMGNKYSAEFRQMFYTLAEKNNMTFIPFLLEGVGGEIKYNQADGIHPTAEGHQILAGNVWDVMKSIL